MCYPISSLFFAYVQKRLVIHWGNVYQVLFNKNHVRPNGSYNTFSCSHCTSKSPIDDQSCALFTFLKIQEWMGGCCCERVWLGGGDGRWRGVPRYSCVSHVTKAARSPTFNGPSSARWPAAIARHSAVAGPRASHLHPPAEPRVYFPHEPASHRLSCRLGLNSPPKADKFTFSFKLTNMG